MADDAPDPPAEPEGTAPVHGPLSALLVDLARPPADEPSRPEPVPGDRVADRFEVVRELGRGGFGVVLEARDTVLPRPVALKFFTRGKGSRMPARSEIAEAEAIAGLAHPNIVHIFDRYNCEAGPFLVLELLEGESLSKRIRRGLLGPAEATRVGLAVARGLAHAHVRGVIHRDLKPSNVFLCSDGQVKLLDFGLAHLMRRTGFDHGGTPGWMPPEQRIGAPQDERTDVWALGAMLFRSLTGKDPTTSKPRLPGQPDLEALIEAMLASDPARRPRDAAHVVEALGPIANRLDAAATPPQARSPEGVLLPRRGRKVQAVGLALALVLLGLLAVAAYFERDRIRRILGLRPEPTVAVLPFEDMSEKHDQGYFADGVTEEIISALAQVEGLKVAGWTSSSSFKGKRIGLDEVGRALQVAHVLEGSVRRSGDRFRIKTELHSTSTGFQIWSRTFESISADIFAVQDEIANRVVEALQVKLVPDRVPRTKSLETRNQEAHEEYLKGRASFRSGSLEGYRLALAHYQEATELDAGYAPAWAGISEVLLRLESWTEVHDPGMRARARDASERAVSLGPRLSDAYRARSMVRAAFLLDWAGALSDAGRALELSPGDPASETYHARALANVGRLTEATAAAAKATQLDPRDPGAWILLGSMYHYGGDTERALGALDRALELAPDNVAANYEMAATLLAAGRANAVLPMAGWMQQVSHARFFTALAQQELGNHEASQRALDELIARNAATDAYQIAAVYAARRENDRAFEWLDRAFDQRDPGLWSTLTDPLLNDLHQDPRWQPFLRRLNLPTGGVSGN